MFSLFHFWFVHCQCEWKSLSHVQLSATPWNSPWNSPGQNTRVGSHSLLQVIFPTQGSIPGLLHCRQIVYRLSHQGSQCIEMWLFLYINLESYSIAEFSLPNRFLVDLSFLLVLVNLVDDLGLSVHKIMSSAIKNILTSSFPKCLFPPPFFCLIILARISSMILNRSGYRVKLEDKRAQCGCPWFFSSPLV